MKRSIYGWRRGKVLMAGTGIPLSDSEEGSIQKEKKNG